MRTHLPKQTLRAVEWPVLLAEGQPEALLFCADSRTYLLHPTRDGYAWAVLDFGFTASAKIGGPNDEVWEASWLHALGADLGSAYEVEGSVWKEELRSVNATHVSYDQEYWGRMKHYVFIFRERVFECLSLGFTVSRCNSPLYKVIGGLASGVRTTREVDNA